MPARRASLTRAVRPEAPQQALRPLPSILLVLAIASFYTVSGGMLWLVGYNYDGLTGSPLTKIHPGTYLILLVVCIAALQDGNPVAFAVALVRRRPGSLFLLFAALVVFVHIVSRAGPGMAGTIDAFMLPPIVIMLYAKSGETTRRRIEIVIHVAMALNAGLALVEFATKHLYFPFRLDGADYVTDTRSSALQGHPLGNATITCVYILALISGGGRMPVLVRSGVVVLQMMAMVAFGGRSALVTTIVLGGLQGCIAIHRILRSGRVPLLGMAVVVLLATITPLVLLGLVAGGFFDALLIRFSNDGGSANARVEMLELVRRIPFRDLLIGPDTAYVDSERRIFGLALGIENPIVRSVLYQGALVTGLLMVALGFFFKELTRDGRRSMALPLLAFLIVINTFESISGKSTMLANTALMLIVLYRRSAAPGPVSSREAMANLDEAGPIRSMASGRSRSASPATRSSRV